MIPSDDQLQPQYWIDRLQMEEHPEGGFYRECYRSTEVLAARCLPERFVSSRVLSTSVYFLLRADQVSHFHRLQADEAWHFYTGAPLRIVTLEENGNLQERDLGLNLDDGAEPHVMVKGQTWVGAYPLAGATFSLFGCTVAPGFEFEDFELGTRESLLKAFPKHESAIVKLTRG